MKIKNSKKTPLPKVDPIGSRIRDIRHNAKLTQKELAAIIGMTPGSVGALENGLYTPNYNVIRALHQRFNVPYEYIIDGVKSPDNIKELSDENRKLKEENARLNRIIDKLTK